MSDKLSLSDHIDVCPFQSPSLTKRLSTASSRSSNSSTSKLRLNHNLSQLDNNFIVEPDINDYDSSSETSIPRSDIQVDMEALPKYMGSQNQQERDQKLGQDQEQAQGRDHKQGRGQGKGQELDKESDKDRNKEQEQALCYSGDIGLESEGLHGLMMLRSSSSSSTSDRIGINTNIGNTIDNVSLSPNARMLELVDTATAKSTPVDVDGNSDGISDGSALPSSYVSFLWNASYPLSDMVPSNYGFTSPQSQNIGGWGYDSCPLQLTTTSPSPHRYSIHSLSSTSSHNSDSSKTLNVSYLAKMAAAAARDRARIWNLGIGGSSSYCDQNERIQINIPTPKPMQLVRPITRQQKKSIGKLASEVELSVPLHPIVTTEEQVSTPFRYPPQTLSTSAATTRTNTSFIPITATPPCVLGHSVFTKEMLQDLMHLNQDSAAKRLNISLSAFRKIKSYFGLTKWPYRQIASLLQQLSGIESELISTISEMVSPSPTTMAALLYAQQQRVNELKAIRLSIITNIQVMRGIEDPDVEQDQSQTKWNMSRFESWVMNTKDQSPLVKLGNQYQHQHQSQVSTSGSTVATTNGEFTTSESSLSQTQTQIKVKVGSSTIVDKEISSPLKPEQLVLDSTFMSSNSNSNISSNLGAGVDMGGIEINSGDKNRAQNQPPGANGYGDESGTEWEMSTSMMKDFLEYMKWLNSPDKSTGNINLPSLKTNEIEKEIEKDTSPARLMLEPMV